MALAPGARLGPYEVSSLLGTGGMGEVYRAHDPKLKREVAIKVLPQQTAADPDPRARFEREAQSIAALNHPSIVTIRQETLAIDPESSDRRRILPTPRAPGVDRGDMSSFMEKS